MILHRLVPGSIAGRTIAVLLIGLTLSHLLSIGAYHYDASNMWDRSFERKLADEIVDVRAVLGGVATEERERVAHLLSSRGFEIHWERGAVAVSDQVRFAGEMNSLVDRLRAIRPELGDLAMNFAFDSGGVGVPLPPFVVSFSLADGSTVGVRTALGGDTSSTSGRLLLSTGLMAAAVLGLSLLLIRASLAPLRALGQAAERLGMDVTAPPLPEDGPVEIRRAARAFNEMQRRIARLLDDRTQMLAAISHDLRTPLTVIQLRTEMIDDTEVRAKIVSDIDDMKFMVESTLSFLRDERSLEDVEPVDVVSTLQTVCDDLSDTGAPVTYCGPDHAVLMGRPVSLKRAFTNIIENAVKYGTTARVALTVEDGRVRVIVEDDGPGIPEAEMERVFQPFHRLDVSRNGDVGGFGLGLAAARTVVRAHGGDIELVNRSEGGLSVTIVLPDAKDRRVERLR